MTHGAATQSPDPVFALGPPLAGAACGVVLAGVAAAILARRSIHRVRSAEARAARAERLAEIGAMTGGLAHEIKNPLSTIGLNAQLLREALRDASLPEPERQRLARRLDLLAREAERLRDILAEFLEYAGELRLDPKPRDLTALVDELVDFFQPQAERQGVRVRADLAPGLPPAPIDADHLKQAVLNLMLNAVQAMTRVSAAEGQAEPVGELILRTRADKDALTLHVIDTGPGIAEEVRSKIFQPYFTTRAGGSGLGLPVTRRIVEAHGGTISLHTEAGRGTEFVIRLPIVPRDST